MSNMDNTQTNPDHKTCNCKIGNCTTSSDHNGKKDSCNCGSGCNCGENCTCNDVTPPSSSTLTTKPCDGSEKKNTCTLFTLSRVIIIDLDEE